jgi:endoglucanase
MECSVAREFRFSSTEQAFSEGFMRVNSFGFLALALSPLAVLACDHDEPAPQTAAAAAPPAAAPAAPVVAAAPAPGPMTVPDKDCPADFVIDDAEDNNNQLLVQGGRNGYWYTYVDDKKSTVTPPAKTKFLQTADGASGSKFAARMNGQISKEGDPLYAGLGFSLTDPKGPYDATQYTGISFWAKAGSGTKNVRLKVPDVNTDPQGKVCTECFNDFGADLTLTEQWKKYTIPFAAMKQMDGWGNPNPPTIDKSKIYGVQWQVNDRGASYDVWIDDVRFTGCK